MKKKRIFVSISVFSIILIFVIVWANCRIKDVAGSFISDNTQLLLKVKTGLLLGVGKYMENGGINEYFSKRIQAAVTLYESGNIRYILVSGDNSTQNYNEPLDMKNSLLEHGVPEHKIILDYAGFRTFDSVIRAKEIFGQDSFIVISQKFHNERAVYIARNNGIAAFGYNADEVTSYIGFMTNVREIFAKVKVFIDTVFDTKPKFLGKKIIIQ